ncbi:MAG TPA: hypothetical protein DEF88_03820 [Porphyromonadaceae bacterium]|nr:hypothetical protein [Porphyromonadaceae bacterium]
MEGNSTGFKSKSDDFNDLDSNSDSLSVLPQLAVYRSDSVMSQDRWMIKTVLLEGKILPKQGTSLGGNQVDSLYLKFSLKGASITYKSYEIPEGERVNPNVPEYKWKVESILPKPSLDIPYVIEGYRYTGYPEDQF